MQLEQWGKKQDRRSELEFSLDAENEIILNDLDHKNLDINTIGDPNLKSKMKSNSNGNSTQISMLENLWIQLTKCNCI